MKSIIALQIKMDTVYTQCVLHILCKYEESEKNRCFITLEHNVLKIISDFSKLFCIQ